MIGSVAWSGLKKWQHRWDYRRFSLQTIDKINGAISIAEALLEKHDLRGWKAYWSGMRKSLAETDHREKQIVFSKYFISKASFEEFVGVALHEITHAMLGPGYGHGDEFVELCREISGSDEYAVPSANFDISRYMFTCPECNYSGSHNSNKDKMCGYCYGEGKKVVFEARKNKIETREW